MVYKNVLIAIKCSRLYNEEVGVYLSTPTLQLIGTAYLTKKGKKLYGDLNLEIEVHDYYPEVKFIDVIDTLILTQNKNSQDIKSIGEQLLENASLK